ncbi:MAG: hypothetical protein MHMPM18_000489 [Marteilia pararefringens]
MDSEVHEKKEGCWEGIKRSFSRILSPKKIKKYIIKYARKFCARGKNIVKPLPYPLKCAIWLEADFISPVIVIIGVLLLINVLYSMFFVYEADIWRLLGYWLFYICASLLRFLWYSNPMALDDKMRDAIGNSQLTEMVKSGETMA